VPHSSYGERDESLVLSKAEAELAEKIARRNGISKEEAATLVMKAVIERKVRERTGKGPARVYSIRRK
jgi:hypothetical protein